MRLVVDADRKKWAASVRIFPVWKSSGASVKASPSQTPLCLAEGHGTSTLPRPSGRGSGAAAVAGCFWSWERPVEVGSGGERAASGLRCSPMVATNPVGLGEVVWFSPQAAGGRRPWYSQNSMYYSANSADVSHLDTIYHARQVPTQRSDQACSPTRSQLRVLVQPGGRKAKDGRARAP